MTILDPDRRALLVNDRPAFSIVLLAFPVQLEGVHVAVLTGHERGLLSAHPLERE